MGLNRWTFRRTFAAPKASFRAGRWTGAAAALVLSACAGDGITAPELSPAPEAQMSVLPQLSQRCGSGIGVDDPIVYIVDGKRMDRDAFRAINPVLILSIEVRRMSPDRPAHEVHITLDPTRS